MSGAAEVRLPTDTDSVRILLVSSLFPGAEDPDYGTFVKGMADELERQGHELAYAVSDRRSGSFVKHLGLQGRALSLARSFRPEVVYAHYLLPAGGAAAIAAAVNRLPLVVTAQGRDVRNIGAMRGVGALTRVVLRRADTTIVTSDYLRRELLARVHEVEGRIEVISNGVDLDRFQGRDSQAARREVRWEGEPPFFLCVGSLDERKNVVRLADAFERLGRGSLAFVGEGPARAALEGRPRVRVVGRVPHAQIPTWVAACDVLCQPSMIEPFGQALVEAMASERSVVATRVGGPPEFVTPEAGVLVDPASIDSLEGALRAAAELPAPNPAARAAAAAHDVRRSAERVAAVLRRAVERRAG